MTHVNPEHGHVCAGTDVKHSQQKIQMLAVLVRVFGLIGQSALAPA